MEVSRGDIVLTDLDPEKGSEQGKTRPTLVIQNDTGNRHSPTTIIAPLTSSYTQIYPTDVELKTENEDVDKDRKVMLNQIATVDIDSRVEKKLGEISSSKMRKVDEAIKISLGLK
ncbi:MAG: type II toxin-antitoxin system PemK/MazF family toxin [Candidatus Nanohalobium sp.]